ncbi:coniferyl aldehyde dehydrogenase [Vibrio sp.]|uniref:coniferyl aldehyde dehydrogenase n=1 Tax=Vibrio sp. TaxID=678 RepID=UPI003D0BA7E9
MERVVDINRWHKEHVKSEQELKHVFIEVRSLYQAQPYPDYSSRLQRLLAVKQALIESQQELARAMSEDYGYRSQFDSLICDVMPAVQHINYTVRNLKRWMRPERRKSGLMLMPSQVRVECQPLGVVGVIVPWNFPIVLSVAPVISAIAAGNRVMVKLSEYTPQTNRVLSQIFSELGDHLYAIEGGSDIAISFSQLPFDHLLFTGSTQVGKLVAKAAASNLTPVTLEMGGKSPALVAPDADMAKAVDAIMLGKALNAGQICVAPDYVMVPKGKEQAFVELYLQRFQARFFDQERVNDLTHIINQSQFERLDQLLKDAELKGAVIHSLPCPETDGERLMLPHLVTGVSEDMRIAQEEIFGPILPVIGYYQFSEAIAYVNRKPKPLALYLMSRDKRLQRSVMQQTHSGGVCINETLLHVAAEDAPFGGVGESGLGNYHGIEGFRTFSNIKTVLTTPTWLPRAQLVLKFRHRIGRILSRWWLR